MSSSVLFKRFATNILIGELLVQSGILSKDRLAEATRQANTKKMQLGQTLVMGGFLTARDLRAAIEAQSLVRDKTIDLNSAVKCLRIVHRSGKNFTDVLQEQGVKALRTSSTGKLGELLLEAGLVSDEQLGKAMQRSLTTGLPLGRMLVLQNILSDTLLNSALEIQVRLRDEMLTRPEAIESLLKAAGKQAPELLAPPSAKGPSFLDAPRRRGIRLGELLVLAGLLTETDVMNALEWGLTNQQPIGQVLVSKGFLTQSLLDAALGLQKQVDEGAIDPMQASECLAKIKHTGESVVQTIADVVTKGAPGKPVINYQKLLILSRVVTDEDVEAAFDISSKTPQVIGRVLSMTGFIDEEILAASLRCHHLLSSGDITQDDAVAALDYCLHQRRDHPIDFDKALAELGWSAHKSLRLEGETEETSEETIEQLSAALVAEEFKAAQAKSGDAKVSPSGDEQGAEPAGAKSTAPAGAKEPDAKPANKETAAADASQKCVDAKVDTDDGGKSDSAEIVNRAEKTEKTRKFTETIAPEDPRSKHLAKLVNAKRSGDQTKVDAANEALGNAFSRLAESYSEQGNYPEAQLVFERILVKRMNEYGSNSPALINDLNNLSGVLCVQGKFNQAEPFLRRVVSILETELTPDPLRVADALTMLAEDYFRQDKFGEALPLIERTLEIRKQHLGPEHTDVADALNDYARTLRKLDRKPEADKVYAQAHAILAKRKAWSKLGFASDEDDEA